MIQSKILKNIFQVKFSKNERYCQQPTHKPLGISEHRLSINMERQWLQAYLHALRSPTDLTIIDKKN
jgi:hypothetical protein